MTAETCAPVVQHANYFRFARKETLVLPRLRSRLFVIVLEGSLRIRCGEWAALFGVDGWVLTPWLSRIAFRTRPGETATIGTIHLVPAQPGVRFGWPPAPDSRENRILEWTVHNLGQEPLAPDVLTSEGAGALLGGTSRVILQTWARGVPPPWEANLHAQFLIAQIWREVRRQTQRSQPLPAPVKRVIDWSRHHPREPATLTGLATIAGVHTTTLHRQFRATFRSSPLRFIMEERLARARDQLPQSDLSVGEIAAATGFNDPLYFSRAFKKRFGCSPTAYRRRHAALS